LEFVQRHLTNGSTGYMNGNITYNVKSIGKAKLAAPVTSVMVLFETLKTTELRADNELSRARRILDLAFESRMSPKLVTCSSSTNYDNRRDY
jgi:hypothetical protein